MPVSSVEYLAFAWPLISYARRKLDAYASHSNFRWSIHKSQFCLVWVCFLFCFLCMHCGRRSPLAGSAIYCSTNKQKQQQNPSTEFTEFRLINRVASDLTASTGWRWVHLDSNVRAAAHTPSAGKKISRMFSVCVITACVMRAKREKLKSYCFGKHSDLLKS